jgi:hypothetical protein
MKIPGWIPKNIQIPQSAQWDAVLLSGLFLFNFFNFSSWLNLGQVAINPWLLFPWLYGFIGLFPLVWRNSAPMTVFAMQWALAVTAWPLMDKYVPVVGIPSCLVCGFFSL